MAGPAVLALASLALSRPAWSQRVSVGTDARPGWVGVAIVATGEGDARSGTVTLRYPVVASVEPGSPAARAGLGAGDTVLAFNGVDARNPAGIGRFLTPGARIVFRVRRERVRDVTLRVAPRPRGADDPRVSVTLETRELPALAYAPLAALGPVALARPSGPHRPLPIVGAQLAHLGAGLAAALRVPDSGILVVDVAPGTPAMRAGLESGDVIVRADSVTITSPAGMLRALQLATGRRMELSVLRRGQLQRLMLTW